jgi:hypothetical protein
MKHPVAIRTDQRKIVWRASFWSGHLDDGQQVMGFDKAKADFSVAGRKIELAHFAGQFAFSLEHDLLLEPNRGGAAFARRMFGD